MLKYLQYYISPITLLFGFFFINQGSLFPTFFFIGFSLFIILGDHFFQKDSKLFNFNYPFFLNLPIYINLILLYLFTLNVVYLFSYKAQNNLYPILDHISLIMILSLFIGIMGTVPGHELIHRKKEKFDQLIGNLLLALSWDCTFAIEHVQGHHKNVGFKNDPATARRGDNIYKFVLKAIISEHIDAWRFQLNNLKKHNQGIFNYHNKILQGYLLSVSFCISTYLIGDIYSLVIFLVCSFIAKSFLEVINFIEHYGLVREKGKAVERKHSWNSNSKISSLYLFNVTRHSSHHEKANLKYWELEPYNKNTPMLPYGYLSMLYLAIFMPKKFFKVMEPKLAQWDNKFASLEEINIIKNKSITI